MNVSALAVIHAHRIFGLEDVEWDSFTFGDAEYTLVFPHRLIAELENMDGEESEEEYRRLIQMLQGIPEGVFVAFNG